MQPPRQIRKRPFDGRVEVWERMQVKWPAVSVPRLATLDEFGQPDHHYTPAHEFTPYSQEWVLIGVFADPAEAGRLFRSNDAAPACAGVEPGSDSEA